MPLFGNCLLTSEGEGAYHGQDNQIHSGCGRSVHGCAVLRVRARGMHFEFYFEQGFELRFCQLCICECRKRIGFRQLRERFCKRICRCGFRNRCARSGC